VSRWRLWQSFGASGLRSQTLGSFENVPGKQHGAKSSVQAIYEVKVVTGVIGSSKLVVICHWYKLSLSHVNDLFSIVVTSKLSLVSCMTWLDHVFEIDNPVWKPAKE